VRQILILGAWSEPKGINVYFFRKNCIYSSSKLLLPFEKFGIFKHGMTTYEQCLWKPCPLVYFFDLMKFVAIEMTLGKVLQFKAHAHEMPSQCIN
jgi:hypothetical protein